MMKEILFNLALIDTVNFCKENNLDCSGTHLIKHPEKYVYSLIRERDGKAIVKTTFYKNSVPTHTIDIK